MRDVRAAQNQRYGTKRNIATIVASINIGATITTHIINTSALAGEEDDEADTSAHGHPHHKSSGQQQQH